MFATLVSAALNSLNLITPNGTIYLAVTVRRLRDAGYEWGHVFWILLPVAGVIILIVLLAQRSAPATAPTALPSRVGR